MYLSWGATAKVAQLDSAYPLLRQPAEAPSAIGSDRNGDLRRQSSMLSTGTIDLLAILSASRALSSETTIDGLRARVVDVLAAMTGATEVQLVLRDEDPQDWVLPTTGGTNPVIGIGSHHDRADAALRTPSA